jgi:hypothetical protein
MNARVLVVRPRLHARDGHELVDADGEVLASIEVAASRDTGAIVVGPRRWSVRRPPTSRTWTVTAGAPGGDDPAAPVEGDVPDPAPTDEVIATITKPSAIRERFEIRFPFGDEPLVIEPHGLIGRRRWAVGHHHAPTIEVVQGVVRRRWHELRPTDPEAAPSGGAPEVSRLLVAFVVALVDTTPPTGLGGLRRPSG